MFMLVLPKYPLRESYFFERNAIMMDVYTVKIPKPTDLLSSTVSSKRSRS